MRMSKATPEGQAPQWQPRIRCHDCPGMLYTVDEGDMNLTGFRGHLRFSKHVRAREERVAKESGS